MFSAFAMRPTPARDFKAEHRGAPNDIFLLLETARL
jgi:hypothetical protein